MAQLPRFPKKPWEITKIHGFSLIFHENPLIFIENQSIFIENQRKIVEFKDFPRFLGKSGKYEIHPPKLCAGIEKKAFGRSGCSKDRLRMFAVLGSARAGAIRAVAKATVATRASVAKSQ